LAEATLTITPTPTPTAIRAKTLITIPTKETQGFKAQRNLLFSTFNNKE
jgi:hypothetical protein